MNLTGAMKQFTDTVDYLGVIKVRVFAGLKNTNPYGFSQLLTVLRFWEADALPLNDTRFSGS